MENFLKQELALRLPEAKFSFSQRGFLIFKYEEEGNENEWRVALKQLTAARTFGNSLFDIRLPTTEADLQSFKWSTHSFQRAVLDRNLLNSETVSALVSQLKLQLPADLPELDGVHIWLRDGLNSAGAFSRSIGSNRNDQDELERRLKLFNAQICTELERQNILGTGIIANENATTGQSILDICLLTPFHFWIGLHSVDLPQHRWPGGVLPIVPSADPPISRAYYKIREAVIWGGLPYVDASKLRVAEIGAAPGGSCQWLLQQGMQVIGIDPADIDPLVTNDRRFEHIRRRALEVKRKDLAGIQWLLSDAIMVPDQVLNAFQEILKHPTIQPLYLVITLKIPELKMLGQLDDWINRVKSWGFNDVRCRQLIFNRQEICLVAGR